jgi:hypothetical protein
MADAASSGFDQHLIRARRFEVEFPDDQPGVYSQMYSGSDFHNFIFFDISFLCCP